MPFQSRNIPLLSSCQIAAQFILNGDGKLSSETALPVLQNCYNDCGYIKLKYFPVNISYWCPCSILGTSFKKSYFFHRKSILNAYKNIFPKQHTYFHFLCLNAVWYSLTLITCFFCTFFTARQHSAKKGTKRLDPDRCLDLKIHCALKKRHEFYLPCCLAAWIVK